MAASSRKLNESRRPSFRYNKEVSLFLHRLKSLQRKHVLLPLLFCLPFSSVKAGDFVNTTTGKTEESPGSYGLPEDRALTQRAQNVLKRFKAGRLSSAKDVNSRFAGHLEFHDANLDGVVDHDVSDSNTNLEGRITSLLPAGKTLEERARESRKQANSQTCGKEDGTWAEDPSGRKIRPICFSPSGIIVDTGSAHDGPNNPHRIMRMSQEATEVSKAAGREYGEAAIREIEKIMRAEYGLADNMKVAAIDELRSEVAWLEEQKGHIYERSWKTLRAARLAGEDTAYATATGTPGADLMHEVDLMISKGAGDREIAEKVAINGSMQNVAFENKNGRWVPYEAPENPAPGYRAPATIPFSQVAQEIRESKQGDTASELYRVHELAKQRVTQGLEQDDNYQKRLANIESCMQKDVWCHNEKTAAQASSPNEQGTLPPRVEAFTPVTGDPGAVFQDTRELIYVTLHEAQNAPIDKIEEIVKGASYDFNRESYPEFFKDLDQLKKESSELQKANEARGNNHYNTATQSARELSGIRLGINDTFREEGASSGAGATPAPAPARAPGRIDPDYNMGAAPRPN
jgi:hypothetical protein